VERQVTPDGEMPSFARRLSRAQRDPAHAQARRWRDRQHVVGGRSQRLGKGVADAASKFGLVGLSKSATLDYAASNIRIDAICPGITDTAMIQRVSGDTPEGRAVMTAQEPIGRMGTPDEIAAAVVWLCSNEASFLLGHALVIDGGQTT
jgi:NAD(P)-dependent dehydrogenase (short-subunit alcohol dehydrogenase family)